jgi:hypothetical protein
LKIKKITVTKPDRHSTDVDFALGLQTESITNVVEWSIKDWNRIKKAVDTYLLSQELKRFKHFEDRRF